MVRDQGEWDRMKEMRNRPDRERERGRKEGAGTNHWRGGGMRSERPAREKRRKKQPAVMEGCPLLLLLLLMLLPTLLLLLCLSSGYARFNAVARAIVSLPLPTLPVRPLLPSSGMKVV